MKMNISAELSEKAQAINAWDMSDIAYRLENRDKLPKNEVEQAITEFKKYMIVRLETGKVLTMTSEIVDLVWHQFILFTKEYHEFCNSIFGEYIHHAPATDKRKPKEENVQNLVDGYTAIFGALPSMWSTDLAKANCDCASE
jgi:hypothetical protein